MKKLDLKSLELFLPQISSDESKIIYGGNSYTGEPIKIEEVVVIGNSDVSHDDDRDRYDYQDNDDDFYDYDNDHDDDYNNQGEQESNIIDELFEKGVFKIAEGASDDFVKNLMETLNKMIESPTGQSLLEKLKETGKTLTFAEVVPDENGRYNTFYDEKTNTLNLGIMSDETYNPKYFPYGTYVEVLSHELVHVLQDFTSGSLTDDDGRQGINIAAEVEAILVAAMVLNELGEAGVTIQREESNDLLEAFREVIAGERELTVELLNEFIERFEELINIVPNADVYSDESKYYKELLESLDGLIINR